MIDYSFGSSSPAAPAFVQTLYPSLSLIGTELSGNYTQMVEVQGALWFVNNAFWNTGLLGFQQGNPLLPSSALRLTDAGVLTLLKAPANAPPPIVWTVTPIGSGGGGSLVTGTAIPTNVPATTANSFVTLLAANPLRQAATIWNDVTRGTNPTQSPLFLAFGTNPGTNLNGASYPIPAGQVATVPAGYTGAVYGAWTATGGNGAQCVEFET